MIESADSDEAIIREAHFLISLAPYGGTAAERILVCLTELCDRLENYLEVEGL